MAMEVPGKRRRGRPKRRWLDIRNDLSERELSREDMQDRAKRRRLIKVGKDDEKKKKSQMIFICKKIGLQSL